MSEWKKKKPVMATDGVEPVELSHPVRELTGITTFESCLANPLKLTTYILYNPEVPFLSIDPMEMCTYIY